MMLREGLSRREILQKCVALGGLTIAPSLAVAEAVNGWGEQECAQRKPTPWNEIGPFYKRLAPHNAMLRGPGDPGLPLAVSGRVYDVRGEVIRAAAIETWQTDHLGHYDLNSYRYRATLAVDANGRYSFESVMPGHYPDRAGAAQPWRGSLDGRPWLFWREGGVVGGRCTSRPCAHRRRRVGCRSRESALS